MTETKKFFTGSQEDAIPRDRWKRPLIIPPEGGTPTAYLRASSLGGLIEDQTNLTKWKMRQAITGIASRPALVMATAAAKGDKRRLDALADQAMEAAGSSDSAQLGTAIHKFTENYDNRLDISGMPPAYKPDIDAYARATSIFEIVAREQFVVADEIQAAGTMDALYRYNGKLYVGDVKTGQIEFGIGKICVQLAIYAHGKAYDPETGQRTSLGEIDQNAGIIVHLPAGTGTCELVWVNLKAGFEAARDLARPVYAWRKRRDLSKPFVSPAEITGQQELLASTPPANMARLETSVPQQELAAVEPAPVALAEPRNMPGTQAGFNKLAAEINAALLSAIGQARSYDELKQIYGLNQTVWTAEHSAAAAARRTELGA